MILGFGNNVQGALAANITASQTVIPVFPGTGPIFAATLTYDPMIPSGISGSVPIYSKLTIADQQETTFEICHLISVSGDNLTVIRGMEGTTAKGWSLNSIVANFATRGSENRFAQIEELQRGFYLSSSATGTANGLVISLPSTFGENSFSAATANFHAPVLVTPAATNTGSVTISASVGLLAFPTNAPLLKSQGSQLAAGDIQAGIPFTVVWSESAQSWYHATVSDLSTYATKLNVQSGALSYAVDSGVANAYVCAFAPVLVSRSEAAPLRFKVSATNTGASTLNDGLGVVALVGGAHAALQGGELFANGDAWVQWNASVGTGSYILLFCTGAPEQISGATKSLHAVNAGQIQTQALTAFTTAGTAPAFTLAPSPAITALAVGQRFRVSFNAAGTLGSSTLNVNGLGAKSLVQFDANGSLVLANITSGFLSDVEYNGVSWVVLDPVSPKNSVVGLARNLRMSVAAASSAANITADEVVVETALGGVTIQLANFSQTINTTGTGAGGMDTGSPPNSGFLAIYAIYSQTTNAVALLAVNATSATAPNVYGGSHMPATYTASALLTVVATNSSSQFLPALVQDRKVSFQYVSTLATSGGATLTAYSISAAVPLNAKSFAGHVSISVTGAGTTTASLASSATTTSNGIGCKFFAVTGTSGTTPQQQPFPLLDLITSQTVYYSLATTGTGAGLTLFICEYMI